MSDLRLPNSAPTDRRNPVALRPRRRSRLFALILAIATVASGLVVTPQPAAAVDVGQFILWPDGRSFTRFGPNAAITIDIGKINFEPVCPTTGTPDAFLPFADVYVVPSAVVPSIDPGITPLKNIDPAKKPNTVQGSAGGGIIDEIVGYTKPSGKHGEGRWAIVIDECQDGVYTPGQDAIFNPAFEVTPIPVGLPPLPEIEDQKEEWEKQKERMDEVRKQFEKFLEQADKIEDALDKMNGGVRANRLLSKLAMESAKFLQDPIPKVCQGATAPVAFLGGKATGIVDKVTDQPGAKEAADWVAGKGRDKIKSLCEKLLGAGNRWLLDPRDVAKVHLANTVKHYEGLAADPPRADFDIVTTLDPWQVVDEADGGEVNRAIYRFAEALGGEQAISGALLDALERYQGAQDARSGSGGLDQARATARYARLLADWQPSYLAGLQSFRDALAANAVDIEDALADARAAAARFEDGLLTPDEIDLFVHQQFFLEEWALLLASVGDGIDADTSVANALAALDAQIAAIPAFVVSMNDLADDMELIVAQLVANPLVDDRSPVADAGGPYTTPMGTPVVLDGTGSTSTGTITTYEWDFDGDGEFDDAVGPQPSFVHPDPLLGLVGLRVTDEGGDVGVDYAPVTVTRVGGPPSATQVAPDGTITVRLGETANFEVDASDPDGDPTTIQWQFDLVDVPGANASVFSYTPTELDEIGIWRVDVVVSAGGERTRQYWVLRVRGADDDGDGYDVPLDCDDTNDEIRPVRDEIIGNLIDDDCSDATSDEGDPPIADFDVDPIGAAVGEGVTFTDTSNEGSAAVTSIAWNFGDGATGTGSPATHTYTTPGDYVVTQTVTDALGKSDTTTQVVVVRVPPTAGFDAPAQIVAGEPASFTDTSTDDGTVSSRTWDFGEGTTSTDTNPTVVFADRGTRTVTLVVTDDDGLSRSSTQNVEVLERPGAAFDLEQVPAPPGATVEFLDLSTDDEPIASWAWTFGDGTTSTERDPSHTYTAPGTYEVTLVVTDADGLTDSTAITLVIGTPPSAGFVFAPAAIDPGDTVTFTDGSTAGDAAIVSWEWSFGDGTTSAVASPTHVFATTGAFPVTLTVTDANGASSTIVQVVPVSVVPPVAAFTVDPGPHFAGDPVGFTDTSSDPDGSIVGRSWDFADGSTSTDTNPTNTFTTPGTYPVNLTVTDDAGATDNAVVEVEVLDPGPIVDFTSTPVPGVTGELVTFTSTATDADGGTLTTFEWNFNDGSPVQNGAIVDHTFAGYGSYAVVLTVTDDDGNERSTGRLITVNAPPVPDFDVSLAAAAGGAQATFTDLSTDADGTIVTFDWDFGDGGTSTDENPVHQYADPGTFTVTLTVTDDVGTSRTATGQIVIGGTPTADFAVDPIAPTTGETVQFDDVSSDPDGVIVARAWDFGNGATSTLADPTTTYPAAGTYTVSLTVTDDDGDTDTVTKQVPVDVVPPDASFDVSVTGAVVDFTDTSTDDGTIVSRSWDFGDGSPVVGGATPTHTYATAGTFPVTLTVVDDTGGQDTVTQLVTIDATVAAAFSQSVGYRPSEFERGGRVVEVSSDQGNTAGTIIDGSIFFDSRWRTAIGQNTDQFVIVELAGKGRDVIDSFDVYTRDSTLSVRDYRVEVSVTGTDPADFTTVLSGTLPRADGTQTFPLTPVRARYLKFVAVNNHGASNTYVREIGVTSRSRDGGAVGVAGGNPASVVSVSTFSSFNVPENVLDGSPDRSAWVTFTGDIDGSFDGVPGAHITLEVGGPTELATINRIEIQSQSSSSRPTGFTVLVSETTTDLAAFREVYTGVYDPAELRISQSFPAVDARYVRVRIDGSTGVNVSIHDLDVFNVLGADVLSSEGVGATVIEASSPETTLSNRWNRMIDFPTTSSSCSTSFRFATNADEFVTILLSEHRPTLIDRVMIHGNGFSSPDSVEILVSTTGIAPGDFTSLGVFDTAISAAPGSVAHFDPVAATYVKVRLIDMVGTSGGFAICSINVFSPEISAPTAVFDNLSTSAAGIDSVLWDFGDGTTSTELHPVHTFPGPGTYDVTLTVTSGAETSVVSAPVVVFPGPATDLMLTPFDPGGFFEGRQFTYEAAPGANGYRWVFELPVETVTRTSRTSSYTSRENGPATATLTVTDQHLQTNTETRSFEILNQAPTANAPRDLTLPWGVEWEMEGQGFSDPAGGNDPIDCAWDFGDGAGSGLLVGCPDVPRFSGIFIVPRPGYFPYAYPTPGDYTATFTAYDDDGGVGSDTTQVTVTKRESLVTLQQVTSDPAGVDVFGSLEDLTDGSDIVGAEVTLTYLGETVTVLTDGNSEFRHRFPNPDASSTVTGTFAGNDLYLPSTLSKPVDPPEADLVIMFDTSSSMNDDRAELLARLDDMVVALSAVADLRMSIVAFPAPGSNSDAIVLTPMTSDIGDVAGGLFAARGGGGNEDGFLAIETGFAPAAGIRPTSGRCGVLFTDESAGRPDDKPDALAALEANRAPLFAVTPNHPNWAGPDGLGEASGGAFFLLNSFRNNAQPVLDAIVASCLASVSRPDIAVEVTDGTFTAARGDQLVYDVTVRNLGGADAADVALTVELPTEVDFVDASDRGTESGGTVTFPAVDLPRGASISRTVTVGVPFGLAPGSVDLVATASAVASVGLDGDRNPDDNQATDTTTATATNATPVVDAGADATVTVGEVFSLDPATYTDADVGDTHTAIIDWGDGSSEPGNLAGSAGSGTVFGGHAYGSPGVLTVEVCVTDQFGAVGCDDLLVTVLPGDEPLPNQRPIVDAGPDAVAIIDQPFSLPPATFTDADPADTHTATVDWGAGAGPQPATLDQTLGTVTSTTTYTEIEITTVTVCVTDSADEPNSTGCDSFFVKIEPPAPPNNPPVVDAGAGAGLRAGDPFVLAPSTFTDPDVGDTHDATVDWGDGSPPVVGRVGADATVEGVVNATHVFAAAGSYTTQVCVIDAGGLTDCDTTVVTVSDGLVPNSPPVVDAGPDQSVAVDTPVTLAPATFVDENSDDLHTATVDWGVGEGTVPGTVDEADGDGTVAAGRTFTAAGTYTVTVCVIDDSGLENNEGCDELELVVSDEGVANEPPIVTVDIPAQVRVGEQVAMMAPFTDANPGDTHTANIDWGDTSGGPGAVDQGQGQGTVTGTHTWTSPGSYTVEVCVTDSADAANSTGCSSVVVTAVANVLPAVSGGDDRTVDEGTPIELSVPFTDGDDATGHTATVDWDDGDGPQPATVTAGVVSSTNTYIDDGVFDVEVCVTDVLGAEHCASIQITVVNVAPTPTLTGPTDATAGSSATLSGTFVDPGAGDTHTAVVDWGDGSGPVQVATVGLSSLIRPVAVVTSSIEASHTYAQPGRYTVTVTVTDDDGGVGTATQAVTVAPAPRPTGELPATGRDSNSVVPTALFVLLLGAALLLIGRRRPRDGITRFRL